MRWTQLAAVVFVSTVAIAPSVSFAAGASEAIEAWNAAWVDRDAGRLAAFYTTDATVLTPYAPTVEGRDEIEAMFARMMGRSISISSQLIEELESGDLRVLRTEWLMTIDTIDQGPMEMDNGGSIEVWRRIDDAWLLHFETFFSYNMPTTNYDAAATPSSTEPPTPEGRSEATEEATEEIPDAPGTAEDPPVSGG